MTGALFARVTVKGLVMGDPLKYIRCPSRLDEAADSDCPLVSLFDGIFMFKESY